MARGAARVAGNDAGGDRQVSSGKSIGALCLTGGLSAHQLFDNRVALPYRDRARSRFFKFGHVYRSARRLSRLPMPARRDTSRPRELPERGVSLYPLKVACSRHFASSSEPL